MPVVPRFIPIVPIIPVMPIVPVVPIVPVAPRDLDRVGFIPHHSAVLWRFGDLLNDRPRAIKAHTEISRVGMLHLFGRNGRREKKRSKQAKVWTEHGRPPPAFHYMRIVTTFRSETSAKIQGTCRQIVGEGRTV